MTQDFQMDVRLEEILPLGEYQAELEKVEVKDTTFGERLMWTFVVQTREGTEQEVVGFTSMSPSTRANAYLWASALMGEINPKTGWGPDDVQGKKCLLALDVAEDSKGAERNKVVRVKAPKADAPKGAGGSKAGKSNKKVEEVDLNEEDFDDIPFAHAPNFHRVIRDIL